MIEDELDLQQVLEYNLNQAGYEVLCARRGQEGLRLAKEGSPSLILLDLMLPDLPGTQICQVLKSDPRTMDIPIVMLTTRGEESDRIIGFELGADDYMVKPFSVRELLLRLAAILRRGVPKRTSVAAANSVRFGCLRIDRSAYRVFVNDDEVHLTELEFKLLLKLFDSKDRVKTRAVLVDEVWSVEAEVGSRTVDTNIKRLREKLGAARGYIKTVRGVGYRFADHPDDEGAQEDSDGY